MKKLSLLLFFSFFSFIAWGQDSELLKRAESGDAFSQFLLGGFFKGNNNYEKAVEWTSKAAEQGYPRAQVEMGLYYLMGIGVNMDIAKAEAWYMKAAAQEYSLAYLDLGILYSQNKKDEAIYWLKKYMDSYYEEYGEEDDIAIEYLQKLGVSYHPGGKKINNEVASRSAKTNSSKSSNYSDNDDLLYQGYYTQNSQGYCQETGQYTDFIGAGTSCNVKIYDSYIIVNGSEFEFVKTDGSWNIYKGFSPFSDMSFYYKVNPKNFEMCYYTVGNGMYGTTTIVYDMVKGDALFNARKNNTNMNGNRYLNDNSSSSGNSSNTNKTNQKICNLCHGSGKCWTCNGKHRYYSSLTSEYLICPNCDTDGLCRGCNGTGRR